MRKLSILIIVIVGSLGLVGCGSSESSKPAASTTTVSNAKAAATKRLQAYLVCLKEHGVKLPTTTTAPGSKSGGAGEAIRSDPDFAKADPICKPNLRVPGLTTTSSAG